MLTTAEVYLWGTRIGILHLPEGRPFAAFEYDRHFQRSGIDRVREETPCGIDKKVRLLTLEDVDMSTLFVPRSGTALGELESSIRQKNDRPVRRSL